MANYCYYVIRVNGSKKAALMTYASTPKAQDDEEILFEGGTDENYTIWFTGSCKASLDAYTQEQPDIGIDLDSYTEDQLRYEDAGCIYWTLTMRQRSELLHVDISIHAWLEGTSINEYSCWIYGHKNYHFSMKDWISMRRSEAPCINDNRIDANARIHIDNDGFCYTGSGMLVDYVGPGGRIIIPENIVSIRDSAFAYCSALTGIIVPEKVKTIAPYTFEGCCNLTDITLSESITKIGDGAFKNCTCLGRLSLPNTVKNIGKESFYNCCELSSIDMPDSLVQIGSYAFFQCNSLKSVDIPENVVKTGNRIFFSCSALERVSLPKNITHLSTSMFYHCKNLQCIESTNILLSTVKDKDLKQRLCVGFAKLHADGKPLETDVAAEYSSYIRKNRKSLYSHAIRNPILLQYMLDESIIPIVDIDDLMVTCSLINLDTAKELLEQYKKHNCKDKKSVVKDRKANVREKEKSIAAWKREWAFTIIEKDRIRLNSYRGVDLDVVIPEYIGKYKVVEIGQAAFSAEAIGKPEDNRTILTRIRSIILPESINKIGSYAFCGCISLMELVIPPLVDTINSGTFRNCKKIRRITLSDNIKTIDKSAFVGCKALTIVTSKDSFAYMFAIEHNKKVVVLDEETSVVQ